MYGFLNPTHCAHGYRLAATPWCSDDPHRCRCCGNAPRTDFCGCTDAAECVHCGRALPAGRWVSGDYGPACFRCLAAREAGAGPA